MTKDYLVKEVAAKFPEHELEFQPNKPWGLEEIGIFGVTGSGQFQDIINALIRFNYEQDTALVIFVFDLSVPPCPEGGREVTPLLLLETRLSFFRILIERWADQRPPRHQVPNPDFLGKIRQVGGRLEYTDSVTINDGGLDRVLNFLRRL